MHELLGINTALTLEGWLVFVRERAAAFLLKARWTKERNPTDTLTPRFYHIAPRSKSLVPFPNSWNDTVLEKWSNNCSVMLLICGYFSAFTDANIYSAPSMSVSLAACLFAVCLSFCYAPSAFPSGSCQWLLMEHHKALTTDLKVEQLALVPSTMSLMWPLHNRRRDLPTLMLTYRPTVLSLSLLSVWHGSCGLISPGPLFRLGWVYKKTRRKPGGASYKWLLIQAPQQNSTSPAQLNRVQDVSVILNDTVKGDFQNYVCLRDPCEAAVYIAGDKAWVVAWGGWI